MTQAEQQARDNFVDAFVPHWCAVVDDALRSINDSIDRANGIYRERRVKKSKNVVYTAGDRKTDKKTWN